MPVRAVNFAAYFMCSLFSRHQSKDVPDALRLSTSHKGRISFLTKDRCWSRLLNTNMLDANFAGMVPLLNGAAGRWMSVQLSGLRHGFWVHWVTMVQLELGLDQKLLRTVIADMDYWTKEAARCPESHSNF